MRRKNAASVRVQMPARGLVSRLPSESADKLRPFTDTQKAFTVAQQVRFAQGVVSNAPGYEQVTLQAPSSATFQIATVVLQVAIGASITFTVTSDPVAGGLTAGTLISIPDTVGTDVYRVTAVTAGPPHIVATLLSIGGSSIAGAPIQGGTIISYANSLNGPVQLIHQGDLITPSWLLDANTLADEGTPLVMTTSNSIYLVTRSYGTSTGTYEASFQLLYIGTPADIGVPWSVADDDDHIIFAQRSNTPQVWTSGSATTVDLPGLPLATKADGVDVFFGHVILWYGDLITWSDVNDYANYIPVSATAATFTLVTSASFTQPAVGSNVTVNVTGNPTAENVTAGQFVRIEKDPYFGYYTVISSTTSSVTLTPVATTSSIPVGTTVASGSQIFSLDANEAGQEQVTGSNVNGPIVTCIQLGDYEFIFKSRSILSMQYVGVGSGIFFIHREVTNEGLLSPRAVINRGDGYLVFLGHRELYLYQGGTSQTPVCMQFTRQLYQELERSRLSEIIMYHNESKEEIWLVYPVSGGQKVLIWNYIEDTASIDLVAPGLRGITALGAVDWTSSIIWSDVPLSSTWANYDPSVTWESLNSGTQDHINLMATGDGLLRVQGNVFTQDGEGYTALAETMDFDFGDRDAFKYVDMVNIEPQVGSNGDGLPLPSPQTLYLQIGTKDSLDGALRWTAPLAVDVSGTAAPPIKVNPGGSGRYIRLRLYSTDPGVQWRVSTFEIYARMGNTY